jgi:hypothetical protein
MIEQLKQFYGREGEIVVPYDAKQKELYKEAHRELSITADSQNLKHYSVELYQARDRIQNKYRGLGLELDLAALCKGILKPTGGNFPAMLLKSFLQKHGFHALVTAEDYRWGRRFIHSVGTSYIPPVKHYFR